ncbi:MAG: recombinase family protein [archaeon]|nr:recombinase family protein [archaeon]
MKKRAALYARVSTDEQAKFGYSLDAQIEKMRDFCFVQDIEIAGEYLDDGFSGRNVRRKAYQLMFSKDERKKWDCIVVLKIDRIHRNSRNFMAMMDDLKKHNQTFISTMDRVNTDNAVGRFVMDIIQRIAQLESEQIGERTYLGMREKAETTQEIMGFVPAFGYSITNGELVSNSELNVVRNIFDMYIEGATLDDIAYRLNRSGVLTRKGNPWNKFNLRNILHNPIYAGYMRWDDLLQKHSAQVAVSIEEYNDVQNLMASKVRDPSKNNPKLLDEKRMKSAVYPREVL